VSILAALTLPIVAALLTVHAEPPDGAASSHHPPDASVEFLLERLQEFLGWTHPAEEGCGTTSGATVVETWPGGLRARYEIVCAGRRTSLE